MNKCIRATELYKLIQKSSEWTQVVSDNADVFLHHHWKTLDSRIQGAFSEVYICRDDVNISVISDQLLLVRAFQHSFYKTFHNSHTFGLVVFFFHLVFLRVLLRTCMKDYVAEFHQKNRNHLFSLVQKTMPAHFWLLFFSLLSWTLSTMLNVLDCAALLLKMVDVCELSSFPPAYSRGMVNRLKHFENRAVRYRLGNN